MNNPLVSIIIPNYNYARYLDLRIESILNQTYKNYEIVILDDKSTDESLKIIEKYKSHPKVTKIILNDHNSGSPFIQWEKGILEARGEIIWIAESDDFCAPSFLEVLVDKYISNDCVLAFCKSRLVDEYGFKLRENHQMAGVIKDIVLSGDRFISNYLGFENHVQNASCAIFSKSIASVVDRCFMDFKGAGDWLLWIEIAEKGNVCYVNQELNCYRLHNNTTNSVVKNGIEFHEMKSIYEKLHDKGYLNEIQLKKCRLNNLLLIRGLKIIPKEVKEELYQMWDVKLIDRLNFFFVVLKIYSNRVIETVVKLLR